MVQSHSARCWVEIDLGRLERNLKRIRAALPAHIRYVAVVKADAYGHGLAATVSRLMRSGVDAFAVANLQEASHITEIGAGWPILVLGPILPAEDPRLAEMRSVIPAVSSDEEIRRFSELAQRIGKPLSVHLKIDTGMGRSGVWHEQASTLYRAIIGSPHLRLAGVFTHFSSADSDPDYTRKQRDLFLTCLKSLPDLPPNLLIHADNSAGLESFPHGGPFNGVRVGLLQFGVLPYPGSLLADVHAEPVLSFHTRVALVKALPKGTSISYNRTCILQRDTRTAVLSCGYGDGISTAASNRGQVLIRGMRCPILGRVTMDQIVVDVSDLEQVEPGDIATLIGAQGAERISIQEFCQWSGQIPWETFTSITKRVQRFYTADTAV